jgi:hypothetical protein
MTPKEKAKELVNKYLRTYPIYDNPTVVISYTNNEAKQCALIAVDEMQLVMTSLWKAAGINKQHRSTYLEEVKQEIEKL